MERHSLRALISVGLLVLLAFLGIALFAKHGGGGRLVLIVIWAATAVAILVSTIRSVMQARQARLERRPEDTL